MSVQPVATARSPSNGYRSRRVLFSLNRAFLGDKIALGAVAARLVSRSARALGIEWAADELSLLDLSNPVSGVFLLAAWHAAPQTSRSPACVQLVRSLAAKNDLLAYETVHTPDIFPAPVQRALAQFVSIKQLWPALAGLASESEWPALKPPVTARQEAADVVAALGLRPGKYFTLHTRLLTRDVERNLDPEKYFAICHAFFAAYGIPTIWIGDRLDLAHGGTAFCTRKLPEGVIDLDGRLTSVLSLGALIATSAGHIGGDTGLTHLAAAVGARTISVERGSNEPNAGCGPFQPAKLASKLSRRASTPAGVRAAMAQALACAATASDPGETAPLRNSHDDVIAAGCRDLPVRTRSASSVPVRVYSSISSGATPEPVIELYERLFASLRLGASYIPFRTNVLGVAASLFRELALPGFTVSLPFKSEILKYADHVDAAAAAIGAANTVACENGAWTAYNTDWIGAMKSLEAAAGAKTFASMRGEDALVLGSGGAARAIAYGLGNKGFKVHLMSRNSRAARLIAQAMPIDNIHGWTEPPRRAFAVLANATSIRSVEEDGAGNWRKLHAGSGTLCLDVAFGDRRSCFSEMVTAAGARLATGNAMLLAQAVAQVDIFHRARTPVAG